MAILGPCTTLESSEVVGDRGWRRPSLHPAADRASNRQLTGNLQQHLAAAPPRTPRTSPRPTAVCWCQGPSWQSVPNPPSPLRLVMTQSPRPIDVAPWLSPLLDASALWTSPPRWMPDAGRGPA
jgi:hypothetical protein